MWFKEKLYTLVVYKLLSWFTGMVDKKHWGKKIRDILVKDDLVEARPKSTCTTFSHALGSFHKNSRLGATVKCGSWLCLFCLMLVNNLQSQPMAVTWLAP